MTVSWQEKVRKKKREARINHGDDGRFLHGEIRKLGKKRSRTEINIMLKEGACTHTHTCKKENFSNKVKHSVCVQHLTVDIL